MRIISIGLFSLFVGLFYVAQAAACKCPIDEETPFDDQVKAELSSATEVFTGTVISIEPVYEERPALAFHKGIKERRRVSFVIEKSWKSDKRNLTIVTGRGPGDCGFQFTVGKVYLVYAFGSPDKLETDICTRTKFLERAARELDVLGAPKYISRDKEKAH